MTEPAIQDNADLPEFDVAVVVFTRVRAVDNLDASGIAERAIAGAVRDAMRVVHGTYHEPYGEIEFRRLSRERNLRVPVVVTEVVHMGVANGDGYLHTEPTRKAYRRYEERHPLCDCGQRIGRHPYYSTCPRREEP
jgi:hypothetical protein